MFSRRERASESSHTVTNVLRKLSDGHKGVEADLIAKVYHDLKQIARSQLRREREGHTLEPTALVHEAYARLIRRPEFRYQDRLHFYGTASRLMRNILVDYARSRNAGKRGGVRRQVTLSESLLVSEDRCVDILVIHQVLERLTALDKGQGKIVELHFFGGLTMKEIALVLQVSERTVNREWTMARAWLRTVLSDSPVHPSANPRGSEEPDGR